MPSIQTDGPAGLTATEALQAIRGGRLTRRGLVEACLARIETLDTSLRAWVTVDGDRALAEAAQKDKNGDDSLLSGLPVGVKDIFETESFPTACGSPIYEGLRTGRDAAPVALARRHGAIIPGKTVTAEFAAYGPVPTGNPHNTAHTPGGSSAGSAAAVGGGMIPLSFGTQTAGSILRPAGYCGIVGYKPTFGLIDAAGVKPVAVALDTVGTFGRTVADAALLAAAAADWPGLASLTPRAPGRVLVCRGPSWDETSPETLDAVERATARFKEAGATVDILPLPEGFQDIVALQMRIQAYSGMRALTYEREHHGEKLSDGLRKIIDDARAELTFEGHLADLQAAESWRLLWDRHVDRDTLIVTASTVGEAPEGLDFTGDPLFDRVWTMLHVPALNLPFATGPHGLPVGVQIVGSRYRDAAFIEHALWAEAALA